jgi:two-component system response regulator RegA
MPGQLLLVDDDRVFGEVMARALSRRGFTVALVRCAADALETMRTRAPDYAVIDLRLANESGLSLVPCLRAVAPQAPIVVLTGYASIATAVEAIKLGATHYLAKPVDADEVVRAFGRQAGDPGAPLADHPLSIERLEWEHIQQVLAQHAGNISATARSLNMHRRTLQRKLAKRPVRG